MVRLATWAAALAAGCAFCGCASTNDGPSTRRGQTSSPTPGARHPESVIVHYLEVVTPEVEGTCRALEAMHAVRFSEPVAALGNARTILLPDGRRIGVRAPMHGGERPVVRPYLLVKDIHAAVEAARAAGAEIAHPPLEIPGMGWFAIYFLGGIEHGLWEK